MTRTNLGSISSGTMLPSDLIPNFVCELKHQKPCKHRKLVRDITARLEATEYCADAEYFSSDEASEDLESLFNALDEYAPQYFYFGAHCGDGAEFGFWLSENFDEDFDGLKVSDLSEVPSDYFGEVLVINDHGNLSLYVKSRNHRVRELWAIV